MLLEVITKKRRNSGECSSGGGRPVKSWEELGERSKRTKVAELSKLHPEHLTKASYRSQRTSGEFNSEMVTVKKSSIPVKMSTVEALSLKIQMDLSDDQYQILRNNSIMHNADIYPSLHDIREEKKKVTLKISV